MPIIKDPKMNHKERKYGIIEVSGGGICFYEKDKNGVTRAMPSGFEIDEKYITVTAPVDPPAIFFDGKKIPFKATITIPNNKWDEVLAAQGPVVRHMFKWANGDDIPETKKGIKKLRELDPNDNDYLDSDFT